MSWLLLLVLFWKPIWHFVMWAKSGFKDVTQKSFFYGWFSDLLGLVTP